MATIATSYAEERDEQRRWRPRPRYAHLPAFDELVVNEFRDPEQQQAWRDRSVAAIVRFAAERVPYYRDLFKRRSLTPADIADVSDLTKLPVLRRSDVVDHEAALLADALPAGEVVGRWMHTSGTTGRPVRVLMSRSSGGMFGVFAQRHYRWFRWNPDGKIAILRGPGVMPRHPDGSVLSEGQVLRSPAWPAVGALMHTGPFVGYSVTNSIDDQLAWLRREQPMYLNTYANVMEAYRLACGDDAVVDSLRGVLSVGCLLTPQARARVEPVMRAPIDEAYGLVEVGIVASRCAADRYHVHTEHVVVEIVDDNAQPCAEGQTGHVVITPLRNFAMPLLRYDTGDLAEVSTAPCPCGRTLPTFRRLIGRHRPNVPEATLRRMFGILDIMEGVPVELMRPLRQSRLHQYRDNTFELRIEAIAPMPAAFVESVLAAWNARFGETPLSIVEVDRLSLPPSGKPQEFTSDLDPDYANA